MRACLNLGCGEHVRPGWINIDARVRVGGVSVIADVRALPFRPASMEQIYAGHLLEHMYPQEAGPALVHWMRLLAPGGHLGVLVPDIQRMWRIHVAGGFSREDMGGAIGGDRDPADPFANHVTVWTQAQLFDFVHRVTWRQPREMPFGDWPLVSEADWQIGVVVRK